MDRQIKSRLQRIKLYEQHKDADIVIFLDRHCANLKRYQKLGKDGLKEQNRKPDHSA